MWKRKKTIGENEIFVTLIRVAQEDPEIRRTLVGILSQKPFQRHSLLNTLVREMKLKGARPISLRPSARCSKMMWQTRHQN